MREILAVLLLLTTGTAMAIEKPDYKVLAQETDFEVRLYGEYLVAEVDLEGDMSEVGNSAFRILAGYIFGNNATGEKMAMTAPVESHRNSDGDTTFSFVMERKYSQDTLPSPVDPRVRINNQPQRVMAVRRYSGTWSEANFSKHHDELLAALRDAGIEPLGPPVWARYNAPFTPWFLRRNEVLIEIDWPMPQASQESHQQARGN
jgi:hypothetical protein